jgi:class 3 adenylate cyclase
VTSPSTFGYARPEDDVYIGYRVDGDGPVDIAYQVDWPGNIDHEWADPTAGAWLRHLASFARVITHDHRGVGVSSRNVELPALETRVSDLMAVLRATATRRPVLAGLFSTGAVNVLLAAMRPMLPRALIWLEPAARYGQAPDYPWGTSAEERELEREFLGLWGTPAYTKAHREDQEAGGNPFAEAWLELETIQARNACTPDVAARLNEIWYETDVRGVLGAVKCPALLLVHEERKKSIEEAEFIASSMADARVHLMPGLAWATEDMPLWAEEVREFVGLPRPTATATTMLATILFTDIVGSTERQAALGNRSWGELISRHHALVRQTLARYGGNEIDTAGDGFYATFDGSARAVRCALEISERVRDLGLEIRAGVHTGECELIDNKVGGISVSIGARVAGAAGSSEVLVSQTVKDLVAGSGLKFEDAGEHELKGVPDHWRLYRAVG